MPENSPIQSAWARILVGLFFCISGAFACLMLLLGGRSFWYLPCALLWTFGGVVWFVRPSLAAALSMFPLLGKAALMLQLLRRFHAMDTSYRLLLVCVLVALALILVSLQRSDGRTRLPLAVSFAVVFISFGVDRLFTNKLTVREYLMNWSANGMAPWGRVETNEKGESPVVIYRRVEGGYCYDALFSSELRTKLTQTNNPVVAVEYNVFSDFGRRRAYNIRTIDGIVFNDGARNLRSGEMYGGYIQTNASRSADCGR